jgi:hypothetical protein
VSRWIRLDVGFDDTEWVFSLSAESQLAWVKLLCYSKRDGIGGRVKAMSYAVAAKRWGVGAENVEKMIHAAKLDGAITENDGDWVVAGWDHYQQPDNTNSERQKRYRERQAQTSEVSAETVTDSNAVTPVIKPLPVSVSVNVPVSLVESRELTPREDWKALRTVFLNVYPQADHLKLSEGNGSFEARVLCDGVDPQEMVDGAKRYAAYITATGKYQYVMSYFEFLKPENAMWRKAWAVPKSKRTEIEKPMIDEFRELKGRTA